MFTITNISKQVQLVRLNSGAEVLVAPRGEREVAETEIRGNSAIDKLKNRKLIEVAEAKKQEEEKPSAAAVPEVVAEAGKAAEGQGAAAAAKPEAAVPEVVAEAGKAAEGQGAAAAPKPDAADPKKPKKPA